MTAIRYSEHLERPVLDNPGAFGALSCVAVAKAD